MTVLPTVPAPEKGWLPLILIAVLTLAIFIVSIISLLSGWLTIFQNLFYIPIILACVYYVKRGFIFSVLLACGYFVLMACFSQDFVVLEGAFIRVLIFILVAGVITYLSIVRIRAEEALKESEEFNRGLVENMPNLVLVYDHDRKIRYVNPAAITILGYSAKEMLGTDIITYVVPHQHAEIAVAIQERFSSGRGASLEVEFITKTGQHITVISKGAPLHFNDQPAVLILLADISERKRAEEALVQLSDRLSLATRAGGVGVWDLDLVNNILTWDDQMFALYGIMREQSGGADEAWQAGVHPDDRVRRDAETQMALRGEKEFDTEFRILLPDGSTRNIRALALVQRDTEGMPLRMIGTNWDITGQKKAEEALRESHEKISLLLNSAAEAIYGLDIHGNCTFCNNSCLHLLGYTHQDELLGRNMHWLIHAKQADGTYFPVESCRIFQAFSKGEATHVDDEVLWRSDGTSFSAEYWSYPQLHDGRVVGSVVTFLDSTERKELEIERDYHEQELMQFSTSLATANKKLNLLSSITRHDINNQLTVLMGYLDMLESEEHDTSLNAYFQTIATAANRIAAMVQFTKEYESIGVQAPAWQDTRSLVDTAATQAPLGRIIVTNELPAGTEVFADPLVVKVCYNLMDNAVRYGGKITTIRFFVEVRDGEHIVVCEDDGDGIVAAEKERIFDRGFGKNTGLGLALSREILSITGITIIETGEPGKGARFEMTVPKGAWRFVDR